MAHKTHLISCKVLMTKSKDRKCYMYLFNFIIIHLILFKLSTVFYLKLSFFREYIKRDLELLRCIHHLKSDLIDSMDHMCVSGTEPSSVVLSQTK